MFKTPTQSPAVFRPYVNKLQDVKGYAKKTEAVTYVPSAGELIVRIMEDEFAAVFIERNYLQEMLRKEADYTSGDTREYLIFIEACLAETDTIEWYAGFMKGSNRKVYNELIQDAMLRELFDRCCEIHLKAIVQSIKDLLLERAMTHGELIVFDKEQNQYLHHLDVHGFRVEKSKVKPGNTIKFCLPNKHVILSLAMEKDC